MTQNQATFQGSRNIGQKTAQVAMSWTMSEANCVAATACSLQGQSPAQTLTTLLWYGFVIDPVAQQGAFTFGTAKAMQVSITRLRASFVTTESLYIPGRIVIYVPSTGQTFTLGPRQLSGDAFGVSCFFFEFQNFIASLFLAQGSQLEVWMESDIDDNVAGGVNSYLSLTLFNFEVPPVSLA